MAIVYLTPADLNATQAQRVLEFLNQVQSAQEIADRVEIADELDVGVRVGQHILDARAQLGGQFETLQQLRNVHQVGPERFTEIVAVLAGIPLPQFSPQALSELVRQEVTQRLASSLLTPVVQTPVAQAPEASSAMPYLIEVNNPQPAFVGQQQNIIVRVLDAVTREPVPNLIVILETFGAVLRTQYGFETRQGEVISSVTGVDGSVRVAAQIDTAQNMTESQRIALVQALSKLDVNAATPLQLANGFAEISAQYQNERETSFRNSVDIHFQAIEDQVANVINQQDYLQQWQYFTVLMRIYVQRNVSATVTTDASGATSLVQNAAIAAQGVHIVRWKNWLLPWVQSYSQALTQDAGLDKAFASAKRRVKDGYGLTSTLIDTAHTFVATQRGRVAEQLSQQVAGRAMQNFLATQLDDLPDATQRTLFPSLTLAAKSIQSADQGALGLVNQTRSDIEKVVDEKVSSPVISSELRDQLAAIDSKLQSVTADAGRIQTDLSSLRTDMTRIDTGISAINTDISNINISLASNTRDIGTIQTSVSRIDSDMVVVKGDIGRANSSIGTINSSLTRMNTDMTELTTRVGKINTDVVKINTDMLSVSGRVDGLQTHVGTLNVPKNPLGPGRIG